MGTREGVARGKFLCPHSRVLFVPTLTIASPTSEFGFQTRGRGRKSALINGICADSRRRLRSFEIASLFGKFSPRPHRRLVKRMHILQQAEGPVAGRGFAPEAASGLGSSFTRGGPRLGLSRSPALMKEAEFPKPSGLVQNLIRTLAKRRLTPGTRVLTSAHYEREKNR